MWLNCDTTHTVSPVWDVTRHRPWHLCWEQTKAFCFHYLGPHYYDPPCINHPLLGLQLKIELLIKGQTWWEEETQWGRWRLVKQQLKRQNKEIKTKSCVKLKEEGGRMMNSEGNEKWRQRNGRGSVRIETVNRGTKEERKKRRNGGELSVGHRRECVACWHCFHAAHFKGPGLWRERGASDNGTGRK